MDTIRNEDSTKDLYITEIPGIIDLWNVEVQNVDVVALKKEVKQLVAGKKKRDKTKSVEDYTALREKIENLGTDTNIKNCMSATDAATMQKSVIGAFDAINGVLKSTRRTHINPNTAFLLVRIKSVAWFCFSIAAGLYFNDVGIDNKDDFTVLDDLRKNFETKKDVTTGKDVTFVKGKNGNCNTSTMTSESLEKIKKHYTSLKLGFRATTVDLDSGGGAFRKEDKCLSWTKKFVQGVYNQCKKFAKK